MASMTGKGLPQHRAQPGRPEGRLKKESLTPSPGYPMPSTISLHQRSRSGAAIILSNDERRDPDMRRIEGMIGGRVGTKRR